MQTLIRFASVMEALPHMDPVDPRSERAVANRHFAFAGSVSPAAFPHSTITGLLEVLILAAFHMDQG